jgi:hypothetical protein
MDNPIPAAPSDMAAERCDKRVLVVSLVAKRGPEIGHNSIPVDDGGEGSWGEFEVEVSEDCELARVRPRGSQMRGGPGIDEGGASRASSSCRRR